MLHLRLADCISVLICLTASTAQAGTYFQTNEVFLDHKSLKEPLLVGAVREKGASSRVVHVSTPAATGSQAQVPMSAVRQGKAPCCTTLHPLAAVRRCTAGQHTWLLPVPSMAE